MLSPWPCGGCRDLTVSPLKNERIHREKEPAWEDTEGRLILTYLPLCVCVIIKKINGFLQVWRCDEYLQLWKNKKQGKGEI